MRNKQFSISAFTLVELLLVMAIIATLLTIIAPYATRSNKGQKLEQKSLNMVEAINYIIDLAVTRKRPTRIIIDPQKGYALEICRREKGENYKPIEGFLGQPINFGEGISILDTTGFATGGNEEYLAFDPGKPWPYASITLMTTETIKTIKINGRQVEIYESEM